MDDEQILIASVQDGEDGLVVACRSCGWESGPTGSGRECGQRWDDHLADVHGGGVVRG